MDREVELRFAACSSLCAALLLACSASVLAQEANSLSLELNKLEPLDKGCRAYMVIDNKSAADFEVFKLDLFLFRPDGVIGRRFAIDLGPLKPAKRSVKLFDLSGSSCEDIGSFLINDVLECRAAGAPVADCLAQLAPSSLATARLSK